MGSSELRLCAVLSVDDEEKLDRDLEADWK
jgi:hypothetical protein